MAIAYQHVQVPKMKVLNLITLFWGWDFSYISLTYIGEYLHFRYLKCLVKLLEKNHYIFVNRRYSFKRLVDFLVHCHVSFRGCKFNLGPVLGEAFLK